MKKTGGKSSVLLQERTDLHCSVVLFNYFDPKMVCGNKVTDKLFQTYTSVNGILAHPSFHQLENIPPDDKKTQHSDSTLVRKQQKHPALCTASSGAPGGARWMPISLLFCHAVPPVSRQSCHRYSSGYGD